MPVAPPRRSMLLLRKIQKPNPSQPPLNADREADSNETDDQTDLKQTAVESVDTAEPEDL